MTASLSRRRLLAVGSAVGAGALLTACTGNDKTDNSNGQTVNNNQGDNTAPGKNGGKPGGAIVELTVGQVTTRVDDCGLG